MDVQCYNLGLGSQVGRQKLFTYANDLTSQHATVYETVLTEMYKSVHTVQTEFEVTTIDHFCSKKGIEFIDFLKIDAEGSELTVLQGAAQMINDGRIGFIQFEFNEMNVMSRCFLRDFYDLLGIQALSP